MTDSISEAGMLSYIIGSLKNSLTLFIWQFPEKYLLLEETQVFYYLSIVVFKQIS